MSLGDAALTFLSVFVAALLAFYLDRIDAALGDWLDPGRSPRQPR